MQTMAGRDPLQSSVSSKDALQRLILPRDEEWHFLRRILSAFLTRWSDRIWLAGGS